MTIFYKITDETGAKIVISSSWRWVGLKAMQECFTERGITGEVVDITPMSTIDNLYFERGEEIDKWLNDNGFPDKIAIIDDQELGEDYQWSTFFKTNSREGLTEELAQKIIEYFNS